MEHLERDRGLVTNESTSMFKMLAADSSIMRHASCVMRDASRLESASCAKQASFYVDGLSLMTWLSMRAQVSPLGQPLKLDRPGTGAAHLMGIEPNGDAFRWPAHWGTEADNWCSPTKPNWLCPLTKWHCPMACSPFARRWVTSRRIPPTTF